MVFGLVALILIAVGVVLVATNRWSSRDVVRWAGIVAVLGAVITLVGLTVSVVNTLTAKAITLDVPVAQYWPVVNPGVTVHGPTATVVDGGFSSAQVSVRGLDSGTRLLWAGGQVAGLLVPAAVCLLIALACWKLMHGDPFASLVARVATWTAVVVLVGGLVSQALHAAAGVRASEALLRITGYEAPDLNKHPVPTGLPDPSSGWTISLWPVGAALVIGAFAVLLRFGTKLTKDVEGLV